MKKFMVLALILAAQFANAQASPNPVGPGLPGPVEMSKDCSVIMKTVAGQPNLEYFVKLAVASCNEAPNVWALQDAVQQAKYSKSSAKQYELMNRFAARTILFTELYKNGTKLRYIALHSLSVYPENGRQGGQHDFNKIAKMLGVGRLEYSDFLEILYMQEPDNRKGAFVQYNHIKVNVSLASYLYEIVFH